MAKLDPKSAADQIRLAWAKNPPQQSAEQTHAESFFKEVCEHLGVEPTPGNLAHASMLLAQQHIEPHFADEYPKALTVKDPKTHRMVPVLWPDDHENAGLPVVFNSAEEEQDYQASLHAPMPPPKEPPEAA